MEKELTNLGLNSIAATEKNSGLVINNSYDSGRGFTHLIGAREFGKLKIYENIAAGETVSFLNEVKVFDENNNIIIDKVLEKGVRYSRETVKIIVLNELLTMLAIAAKDNNKSFDIEKAKTKITDLLNKSYYSQSYDAILNWAEDIGIELL